MTYNEKRVHAGAGRAARWTTQMVVGLLVGSLLLVVPGAVASAGSVASTKSQIATLEAQVVAESGEIHQLTGRYAAAETDAESLDAEVAVERGDLVGLRRQLASSRSALTLTAIDSYVGDDAGGVLADTSDGAGPEVKAEYLDIATGNVSENIDAYDLHLRLVASAMATIRSEQVANRRVLTEAADARQQALGIAASEEQRLDSLEGQLDAEEHAATQGAPVDGGLVDVVEAQTGGASPSLPATTTTTSTTTAAPPAADPTTSTSTSTSTSTTTTSTTTTLPPPVTAPDPPPSSGDGGAGGVWLELRECESGDNYQADTGNGFYGAYQFSEQTWSGLGYPGYPYQEPPAMQDAAAQRLQAESGWGQWPACAAELGLT